MTKDGLKILDSDMHVFEPHDLYASLPGVEKTSLAKIFWDNCARLYGL